MRIELQLFDRIDTYLNGSMNAANRSAFEQEMKESAELRAMVETQKLIVQGVQRQALLAEINRFSKPNPMWTITKWLSIGIVVAVLISAGIWWKFAENNQPAAQKPQQAKFEKAADAISTPPKDSTSETGIIDGGMLPGQPLLHENTTVSIAGIGDKPIVAESLPGTDPYDVGGLKTWVLPQRQYFNIENKSGETIECSNGTLIIVPPNAFIDQTGKFITAEVQLEVVEALSVADMLAYNLTTMNDGKLLQSGGMVYIRPTVNGSKVEIHPKRPLYIEIPTEKKLPEMLAWKGETSGGNINWTQPKKLEKFLTPVKFDLLDFLPVGFADEVEASLPFRNHYTISKFLTDSLYYSLATVEGEKWNFNPGSKPEEEEIVRIKKNTYALGGIVIEDGTKEPIAHAKVRIYSFRLIKTFSKDSVASLLIDSAFTNSEGNFITKNMKDRSIYFTVDCPDYESYQSPELILPLNRLLTFQPAVTLKRLKPKDPKAAAFQQVTSSIYKNNTVSCMIDPLSIKAIKTKEFSYTFLATREFEERIKVLHQMPDAQNLLEIYINNLTGNLWEADSLVALKLSGEDRKRFEDFAAEKHTNVVKDRNIYSLQLAAYYNKKRADYEKTILKMRGEYKAKNKQELASLGAQLSAASQELAATGTIPVASIPFKTAESRALKPTPAIRNSYATCWYETGWMNIDCYNSLLANGSKSVDISLNLAGSRVYQSINTLKTIVPLASDGLRAKAMFPRNGAEGSFAMKSAFCIGMKKEKDVIQYAEQRYDPYSSEEVQLQWEKLTEKQFYDRLKGLPYGDTEFTTYVKAHEKEILARQAIAEKQEVIALEMKRVRDRILLENALIERLEKIAGSCGMSAQAQENAAKPEKVNAKTITIPPAFPGGAAALRQFLNTSLVYPEKAMKANISGKSYARFLVSEDGTISNISITKGLDKCPECDAEVIRVIRLMPKWTPARTNGKNTAEYFDLPVSFQLQ